MNFTLRVLALIFTGVTVSKALELAKAEEIHDALSTNDNAKTLETPAESLFTEFESKDRNLAGTETLRKSEFESVKKRVLKIEAAQKERFKQNAKQHAPIKFTPDGKEWRMGTSTETTVTSDKRGKRALRGSDEITEEVQETYTSYDLKQVDDNGKETGFGSAVISPDGSLQMAFTVEYPPEGGLAQQQIKMYQQEEDGTVTETTLDKDAQDVLAKKDVRQMTMQFSDPNATIAEDKSGRRRAQSTQVGTRNFVMDFAYAEGAVSSIGVNNLQANAIQQTNLINQILANSGLSGHIQVKLGKIIRTGKPGTGDGRSDLLTSNSFERGVNSHSLTYILAPWETSGCGVAWLFGNRAGASLLPSSADLMKRRLTTAVSLDCSIARYTVVHEFIHTLGGDHDMNNALSGNAFPSARAWRSAFNTGYNNYGTDGTILAYSDRRYPYISSKEGPYGSAAEDNVGTVKITSQMIANFLGIPINGQTMPPSSEQITKTPTTKTPTTAKPTVFPTTRVPTLKPTMQPSSKATISPTVKNATKVPTTKATISPTVKATKSPTLKATNAPVVPTRKPTTKPTPVPTKFVPSTSKPTARPTNPTAKPTRAPTRQPTAISAQPLLNINRQVAVVYKPVTQVDKIIISLSGKINPDGSRIMARRMELTKNAVTKKWEFLFLNTNGRVNGKPKDIIASNFKLNEKVLDSLKLDAKSQNTFTFVNDEGGIEIYVTPIKPKKGKAQLLVTVLKISTMDDAAEINLDFSAIDKKNIVIGKITPLANNIGRRLESLSWSETVKEHQDYASLPEALDNIYKDQDLTGAIKISDESILEFLMQTTRHFMTEAIEDKYLYNVHEVLAYIANSDLGVEILSALDLIRLEAISKELEVPVDTFLHNPELAKNIFANSETQNIAALFKNFSDQQKIDLIADVNIQQIQGNKELEGIYASYKVLVEYKNDPEFLKFSEKRHGKQTP